MDNSTSISSTTRIVPPHATRIDTESASIRKICKPASPGDAKETSRVSNHDIKRETFEPSAPIPPDFKHEIHPDPSPEHCKKELDPRSESLNASIVSCPIYSKLGCKKGATLGDLFLSANPRVDLRLIKKHFRGQRVRVEKRRLTGFDSRVKIPPRLSRGRGTRRTLEQDGKSGTAGCDGNMMTGERVGKHELIMPSEAWALPMGGRDTKSRNKVVVRHFEVKSSYHPKETNQKTVCDVPKVKKGCQNDFVFETTWKDAPRKRAKIAAVARTKRPSSSGGPRPCTQGSRADVIGVFTENLAPTPASSCPSSWMPNHFSTCSTPLPTPPYTQPSSGGATSLEQCAKDTRKLASFLQEIGAEYCQAQQIYSRLEADLDRLGCSTGGYGTRIDECKISTANLGKWMDRVASGVERMAVNEGLKK